MFEAIKKLFSKEERIERDNGAYDMVSEMTIRSYIPNSLNIQHIPPASPGIWEKLTNMDSDVAGFSMAIWVNGNHPHLHHIYSYTSSKSNRVIDIELAGPCNFPKAMDMLRDQVNTNTWYLTDHQVVLHKKKK